MATRQKSSCNLATSKGESRDSGSALSLPSAAVERLGLDAWRRTEPVEMQLGTYIRTSITELEGTDSKKINKIIRHCVIGYLQSCFGIFVAVLSAPFPWKSLLIFWTVSCWCLVKTGEDANPVFFSVMKGFHRNWNDNLQCKMQLEICSIFSSKCPVATKNKW